VDASPEEPDLTGHTIRCENWYGDHIMAKHSTKIQAERGVLLASGQAVENVNNNVEVVDPIKAYAQSLVQAYEAECLAAKSHQKGQALPNADIMWAVDTLFDAVGINQGPVRDVLDKKVPALLKMKYAQMGDSTNLVAVKVGHIIKEIPNNELRELRERQLAHMQDPKTKDNFYRRIYGLGYRKEQKRFEIREGDLVRTARPKITEDNPQA
jgi:hypothetical protein